MVLKCPFKQAVACCVVFWPCRVECVAWHVKCTSVLSCLCLVKAISSICLAVGCCVRASSSMPCPQAFIAPSAPNFSIWDFISRLSLFANCRALASRDVQSASTILENLRKAQMASGCAGLSPGCCAQQLLHETSIHCAWAECVGTEDVGLNCVRGLTAYELAVTMDPSTW